MRHRRDRGAWVRGNVRRRFDGDGAGDIVSSHGPMLVVFHNPLDDDDDGDGIPNVAEICIPY